MGVAGRLGARSGGALQQRTLREHPVAFAAALPRHRGELPPAQPEMEPDRPVKDGPPTKWPTAGLGGDPPTHPGWNFVAQPAEWPNIELDKVNVVPDRSCTRSAQRTPKLSVAACNAHGGSNSCHASDLSSARRIREARLVPPAVFM